MNLEPRYLRSKLDTYLLEDFMEDNDNNRIEFYFIMLDENLKYVVDIKIILVRPKGVLWELGLSCTWLFFDR